MWQNIDVYIDDIGDISRLQEGSVERKRCDAFRHGYHIIKPKKGRLENAFHPVYLNYACLNACNKGVNDSANTAEREKVTREAQRPPLGD